MEKTCVCCCIELMNELSFQNFSAGKKIFLEGLKKVWKITCETLILFRNYFWIIFNLIICHCVKGVRIRSHSGPYFSAFGLNTERYRGSLCIQSECEKMWTRTTPDTDTFRAVHSIHLSMAMAVSVHFILCKFTSSQNLERRFWLNVTEISKFQKKILQLPRIKIASIF